MKKSTLVVFCFFLSLFSYSQISFEPGYFILESGERQECLIKNVDWRATPTQFQYKTSETGRELSGDKETIKEFGIKDISRYVRAKVKMDKASDDLQNLDYVKNRPLVEEEIYLKVLVEGQATLYSWSNNNMERFFYTHNNSIIEQLVYNRYFAPKKSDVANDRIKENTKFKQQLWNTLKCAGIDMNRLEKIEYKKSSLVSFFAEYNNCANADYINYSITQKREVFHISIRPRLNYNSLSISNSESATKDTEFDSQINPAIGLDTEFILPFNKNKWSITIEPTFRYYGNMKTVESSAVSGGTLTTEIEYNSIEIPIGLRHYFFLSEKSKLFVNVSYIPDLIVNSFIEFRRFDESVLPSEAELGSRPNVALGGGFLLSNKFSIELRYHTDRNVMSNFTFWDARYKNISLIAGYRLF